MKLYDWFIDNLMLIIFLAIVLFIFGIGIAGIWAIVAGYVILGVLILLAFAVVATVFVIFLKYFAEVGLMAMKNGIL